MVLKSGMQKKLKDGSGRPLLGAHFSIAGGLHKALYTARDYGCTAVQIFTKNASTWKERTLTDQDIETFDRARQETGITAIASHTAYLINPKDRVFSLQAPRPSFGTLSFEGHSARARDGSLLHLL